MPVRRRVLHDRQDDRAAYLIEEAISPGSLADAAKRPTVHRRLAASFRATGP